MKELSEEDNYEKIILNAIRSGKFPLIPKTIASVVIYHDRWCKYFSNKHCNCNPTIEIEYSAISKESSKQ